MTESELQSTRQAVSVTQGNDWLTDGYLGIVVNVSDFDAVTVPDDVLVGILTEAEMDFEPSELWVMVLVLLKSVALPDVVLLGFTLVVTVYVEPANVRVLVSLLWSYEPYVHLTVTLQVTDEVLFATEYEFSVNEIDAVTAMSHHRP